MGFVEAGSIDLRCEIVTDPGQIRCDCTVDKRTFLGLAIDLLPELMPSTAPGDIVGGGRTRGLCCAGLSFGVPVALAQCPTNAWNALVKRHLCAPKNVARLNYPNLFMTVLKHKTKQLFEQNVVVEEEQWRVGKPKVKLNAIDESIKIDKPERAKAKSFVKFEAVSKMPTKARLIQGNKNECTAYEYPAEYKAMSQTLHDLGGELFEKAGIKFHFRYAGGMSHDEMSDQFTEWVSRPGHKLYDERDGKNWDATMQEALLVSEMRIYQMLKMQAAKAFAERCKEVHGKVMAKINAIEKIVIRYVTRWKRLSGDWNTSVGNTIISMIIAFVVLTELPVEMRPTFVGAFFMGDDYLAVMCYDSEPDPQALALALNFGESAMGITPVRGIFRDPFKVTFISLGVWPRHDGGYQFVPQPAKQLRKLFWAAKQLPQAMIQNYQSMIAVSFWPVYWGFPMMMKFLKAHYTVKNPKIDLHYMGVWSEHIMTKLTKNVRPVDWQAGVVYKYGLPYSATHFECDFKLGTVYISPVVDEMLRQENLDPDERPSAVAS